LESIVTEAEFKELAARGFNRIPLILETFADLDTPLSLYVKLANQRYTFLLESVVGGERFGRYSFVGLAAKIRIKAYGNKVEVEDRGGIVERYEGDPLEFIEQFQARFKVAPRPGMPRFCGGLVGYFGYDTVRYIEPRLARTQNPDKLGMPDIMLVLSEELVVVDNLAGKIYLVYYADPNEPEAYLRGQDRLLALRRKLRQPVAIPFQTATQVTRVETETSEDDFKAAVLKAKEYIAAGDIMQVVLSQRTRMPFTERPLSLYRALRSLNPSPYMFYYDFGDAHIVGSSPEILVRQETNGDGARVTVRPIAGTRPRGVTRERDDALAAEMLADPKEVAEHIMLLDLGRNDVGRVAQTGSVQVTEQMQIERYSHVMHIVSNVEGKLKDGMSSIDVLRATFPAGTLSGAPKVRAMEIIDELEPTKRGVYGGAVGYVGFHGDMDLAIAIRTAVVKDGTLYAQAGAGIVADSDPQAEWEETRNKARALIRAAELVQLGLDAEM
jgi:anthranilate synthase component 1